MSDLTPTLQLRLLRGEAHLTLEEFASLMEGESSLNAQQLTSLPGAALIMSAQSDLLDLRADPLSPDVHARAQQTARDAAAQARCLVWERQLNAQLDDEFIPLTPEDWPDAALLCLWNGAAQAIHEATGDLSGGVSDAQARTLSPLLRGWRDACGGQLRSSDSEGMAELTQLLGLSHPNLTLRPLVSGAPELHREGPDILSWHTLAQLSRRDDDLTLWHFVDFARPAHSDGHLISPQAYWGATGPGSVNEQRAARLRDTLTVQRALIKARGHTTGDAQDEPLTAQLRGLTLPRNGSNIAGGRTMTLIAALLLCGESGLAFVRRRRAQGQELNDLDEITRQCALLVPHVQPPLRGELMALWQAAGAGA